MTFERAANILCQSLDVQDHGGTVFFDATSRVRNQDNAGSDDKDSQRIAEVLSSSTCGTSSGSDRQDASCDVAAFMPMEEKVLHNLLAQYPRGKMWTFDPDGNASFSEGEMDLDQDQKQSESSKRNRLNRSKVEAIEIQKYFPGVSQLLFTGLWDAGSNRW